MKTKLMITVFALMAGVAMGQTPTGLTTPDDGYGDQFLASATITKGMVPAENNAYTYLEQGIQLSKDENYYASLEVLDKALALEPSLAEAHDYKAINYIKLGRFVKALKSVNNALEYNPSLAEAYNHRGIVHFYLQNGEQAMEDYTIAISLKPDYGTAYYNRGLLKLTIGDDKGALEDLTRAQELNCSDAAPVINEFLAEK
ncbi:MAG: tetratricopeptide repeat protein [Bacteroidales bacterium]